MRGNERGTVYFYVVLFVLAAVALTISSASAVQALLRERVTERHRLEAGWAARGGIESALESIASGREAAGEVPVGTGSAAVAVTPVEGGGGLLDVVSVGSVPGPGGAVAARVRVEARVRPGAGLPVIVRWREGR